MINKNGFVLVEEHEEERESYNVVDRINDLNDELSIEIILKNISEQINDEVPYVQRYNYITLFREKVNKIKDEVNSSDLKSHLYDLLVNLIDLVGEGLDEKYSVDIGEELDDTDDIFEYLDKIEVLYEFFFIRNYINVKDLIYRNLLKNKEELVERYKKLTAEQDSDIDLFVLQDKRKFKHQEDILVINYITDIIRDIEASYTSGYEMFKEIINIDLYELYNNNMDHLLINYGTDFIILDDKEAVSKYFDILNNPKYMTEIRNDIMLDFLKNVETED